MCGIAYGITKIIVILGNLLLLCIGVGAIGLGIYSRVEMGNTESNLDIDNTSEIIAIIFVVLGFLLVIIASFGIFGACNDSKVLLSIYFLLILLIICAQVGASIYGFIERDDIPNELQTAWENTDCNDRNQVEERLKCCGFDSNVLNSTCPCGYTDGNNETQTCKTALENSLKDNLALVAGVGIGLIVLEFIALFLSCCLCNGITSKKVEYDEF